MAVKSKKPRPRATYRGSPSRVGSRWAKPVEVKERPFRGSIKLNRSSRWPRAKSYQHAREIGPSTEAVR